MNNRNKRSIVVNLNHDQGKKVLWSLLRDADVLMENYRPDVMSKFGFSFDAVHKINPKLVYASINGFGSEGPYAGQRVYDAVIQAVSGIATLQTDKESGRPQMINSLICDKLTALTAAQSICSALLALNSERLRDSRMVITLICSRKRAMATLQQCRSNPGRLQRWLKPWASMTHSMTTAD